MDAEKLVILLKDPEVSRQLAELLYSPAIKERLVEISQEPLVAKQVARLLHDPVVIDAVAPLIHQALWWIALPVALSAVTLVAVLYNMALLKKLRRDSGQY